jgi:hypothetical protein
MRAKFTARPDPEPLERLVDDRADLARAVEVLDAAIQRIGREFYAEQYDARPR